ncbi:hypothetical protein EIP86_005786 [Pleurotus ostreatoroseus]|nr:hypothetical protein EIP86_005786 [Pleurotus ostreatoroseus]
MDGLSHIFKSLVMDNHASPSQNVLHALTSVLGDFNIALSNYALPPSRMSTPVSRLPSNQSQRQDVAPGLYAIPTAQPNGIRRIRLDAEDLDAVEVGHASLFFNFRHNEHFARHTALHFFTVVPDNAQVFAASPVRSVVKLQFVMYPTTPFAVDPRILSRLDLASAPVFHYELKLPAAPNATDSRVVPAGVHAASLVGNGQDVDVPPAPTITGTHATPAVDNIPAATTTGASDRPMQPHAVTGAQVVQAPTSSIADDVVDPAVPANTTHAVDRVDGTQVGARANIAAGANAANVPNVVPNTIVPTDELMIRVSVNFLSQTTNAGCSQTDLLIVCEHAAALLVRGKLLERGHVLPGYHDVIEAFTVLVSLAGFNHVVAYAHCFTSDVSVDYVPVPLASRVPNNVPGSGVATNEHRPSAATATSVSIKDDLRFYDGLYPKGQQ